MKCNEVTWQLSQCFPVPPPPHTHTRPLLTVWRFDHLLSAAAAVCLSKVFFFLLVLLKYFQFVSTKEHQHVAASDTQTRVWVSGGEEAG